MKTVLMAILCSSLLARASNEQPPTLPGMPKPAK
jgi:hypothetical protein